MLHDERCLAAVLHDPPYHLRHRVTLLHVHVRARLIEQVEVRVPSEAGSDRDSLKLAAAEAAVEAAGHCVEIHGGNGYSEEYPAARLFRDAKMYQIGEGAQNVLKAVVARDLLGLK